MRTALAHPVELADFLRLARPDLAAHFRFDAAQPLGREVVTEDWRRREADLPFLIPFRRVDGGETAVQVYVLLEHQSAGDPLVPLRQLFLTVAHWNDQWQAWQDLPHPRAPLRLHPVLPIVLHTGERPWNTVTTLADLVDAPPELLPHLPVWEPVFWQLSAQDPAALLEGAPVARLLGVMATFDRGQGGYEPAGGA
ncbi:MAG: Rpn family recombination-promoting nuclease/putative transposase [Gemmataceae bacterium]|nr:Rpn family recombination-promoting nuclease/putative transposase [Gemmataceae bacterium]